MRQLIAALATMALLAVPAAASDWNFYGSARVSTFYSKIDNDMFKGGTDSKNYEQNLHGNSRIGAKVKVSDEVSGRFEYGANGGNANIRLLYGEWNFGAGKLIIGQAYTPFLVVTNQAYNYSGLNLGDTGLGYFGTIYSGREALVGLKIGGLYIAAVEQEDDVYNTGPAGSTTKVMAPELHARYMFKGPKWMVQVLGGVSQFEIQNGNNEANVTSYLIGAGGRLAIGPAYITGGAWTGQNAGNLIDQYGSLNPDKSGQHFARWDGTTLTDNDGYGFHFSAGFFFSKMIKMEAGYGYTNSELDVSGSVEDDAEVYYLQSTITLAPGVIVVPEIGCIDFKGTGLGQMDATYIGMKWQIDF